MTTAASAFPLIGSQPVGNFYVPDNVRNHTLGTVLSANDPYWGGQELIYLQAGATLNMGQVVVWNQAFSATSVPNTANLGQRVAVALTPVANGAFGWFVIGGNAVTNSTASVAANAAIGITAAGQLGANSAGKQILNAHVVAPATTTVAKANTQTQSGSNIIRATNTDGWFVGGFVSGTGIPASTTITAIDPDNRTVTLNNAATATGSVTVTVTYNNATIFYNVVNVDRPFAQGATT